MRPCKLCGLNLDLVGKSHRCVPRVSQIAAEAKAAAVAKPEKSVAKPLPDVAKPVAKHYAGRYRDAEQRKAYMRSYMREYQRKRRAEKLAAEQACRST
jgi:hypothetical protein